MSLHVLSLHVHPRTDALLPGAEVLQTDAELVGAEGAVGAPLTDALLAGVVGAVGATLAAVAGSTIGCSTCNQQSRTTDMR